MVAIKHRSRTVNATLPGRGQGSVTAQSGASLPLAGSASESGMTPLEMMDAALAGCLALSVRIAARERRWHERLIDVSVEVQHEKAPDAPSRIARFACVFAISGDFSQGERDELIAAAHTLCTVGNTLDGPVDITDVDALEPEDG